MTNMFIDPQRPGIIRWNDDPTAGILAGMRAAEIVEAVNGYQRLRGTIEIAIEAIERGSTATPVVEILRGALTAAEGRSDG